MRTSNHMGENHHAHTFGFTNHSNQIDKGSCVPVCAALLQPFLLLLFCRHVRIRSPWGYLHRARLLPRRRPRSRPMLQCSCCHCGRRLFRASPVGSFLAHPQLARGSSDVSHAVFQFFVPCGTSAAYRLYRQAAPIFCTARLYTSSPETGNEWLRSAARFRAGRLCLGCGAGALRYDDAVFRKRYEGSRCTFYVTVLRYGLRYGERDHVLDAFVRKRYVSFYRDHQNEHFPPYS